MRFDTLITQVSDLVECEKIAGAEVHVTVAGNLTVHETFGRLDREHNIAWPANALCRIASMTKPVTATAAIILVDAGLLKLSDPLSAYLPEFAEMTVARYDRPNDPSRVMAGIEPARSSIMIRDLLRHTSGLIGSYSDSPLAQVYAEAGLTDWQGSLKDFVGTIADLPLDSHPGTQWDYSHASNILGYLVEVVSGQPLDDFVRDRIAKPLGLVDTRFVVPPDKVERLPHLYRYEKAELTLAEKAGESRYLRAPRALSGGGGFGTDEGFGGLVSTVTDFDLFMRTLVNGGSNGDVRILTSESAQELQRDQLAGIPARGLPPGCGFNMYSAVLADPSAFVGPGSPGQYWWAGSCNTFFFVDPPTGTIAQMMTQMLPWPLHRLMTKFRRWCQAGLDG